MSAMGLIAPLAHAGMHDLSHGNGLLHVLTSPEHMLGVGAVIVGAYVAWAILRRTTARKAQARTARSSLPYA